MSYTYQRLDENEIRLLKVEPGSEDEQIQGTVSHVHFSSPGDLRYETISYCWGDSQRRGTVILDGFQIDVPASSVDALKCMRHPDRHRVLWIDSICINQADIIERNSQVDMLGSIYASSLMNLVYLGEDDGTGEAAKKAVADVLEDIRAETNDLREFRDVIEQFRWLRRHEKKWPNLNESAEQALQKLFGRPWFEYVHFSSTQTGLLKLTATLTGVFGWSRRQ